MTAPREIVNRTLSFEGPERVARSFRDSDFVSCSSSATTHATPWARTGDAWERIDEWGNRWRRIDPTSKGEVVKGVFEDLSAVETYRFPDFSQASDYERVRACRAEHPDRYLLGGMPGFAFNIARKMRKLDNYLVDLVLQPEPMHRLHDRIDAMLSDMIRRYAEAGVDGVMFPEDWGTQTQTLISPDLWRQEFFPRFCELCGLAHDARISVFMHSCGQTEAIVPGLMEAGVDVLQFDQPDLHGLDNLAAHQERGNITFWCPVDIQATLQSGREDLIRAKVREMLDKLWRGRGGFIAGYYGDNASIGLDPEWQDMACDEFLKCGVASRYAAQG